MSTSHGPAALDPLDFLAVDSSLSVEERAVRDTVRFGRRGCCRTSLNGLRPAQSPDPHGLARKFGQLGLLGMHLDG